MAEKEYSDLNAEEVISQVEFYLSDKNLLNSKSDYLKTIITSTSGDGMVDLATLCSYPKMRKLLKIGKKDVITEQNLGVVADVLRTSDFLTISSDVSDLAEREKETMDYEEMEQYQFHHYSTDEEVESSKIKFPKGMTITVRLVHRTSRGASKRKSRQDDVTEEDLKDVFEKFGAIQYLHFAKPQDQWHIQFQESQASDEALIVATRTDGGLPVNNYICILERYSGFDRSFQRLPRKVFRPANPFMQQLRIRQYREPSMNQLFPKQSKDNTMPRFGIWWCVPEVHYLLNRDEIPVDKHLPPEEACRLKIHYMSWVKGSKKSKNPNAPKTPNYREIKTRYLREILDSEHPSLRNPADGPVHRGKRFNKHLKDQNVLDQQQATELMLSCHMTFQMADLLTDMRHRALEFAARERCVCTPVHPDRYLMQADDLCTLIRDLLGQQFQPKIHVKDVDGNLMLHEISLYVNESMELVRCTGKQYSGASDDLIMF